MEKVFGYVRVSTSKQVVKGLGITTQKQEIKKYCEDNNLELVCIYEDKGISGTKIDRDGLTDLLSSFNGIKKVIVQNTSRLWRDDNARVFISHTLKKLGADVISIQQPNYSIYSVNPNDIFVNGIMELLDQYERLTINLKLARGRKTKAKAGDKGCGIAPLGYKWDNNAKIVIDEPNAEKIKVIFTKYLELGSLGKVKLYLDDNNITTLRGKLFSKQAIQNILSNDFYKSIVTHGNIKLKGNHPTIINKITFGKVQSKLAFNSKF